MRWKIGITLISAIMMAGCGASGGGGSGPKIAPAATTSGAFPQAKTSPGLTINTPLDDFSIAAPPVGGLVLMAKATGPELVPGMASGDLPAPQATSDGATQEQNNPGLPSATAPDVLSISNTVLDDLSIASAVFDGLTIAGRLDPLPGPGSTPLAHATGAQMVQEMTRGNLIAPPPNSNPGPVDRGLTLPVPLVEQLVLADPNVASNPEPGTAILSLLAVGAVALAARRRRGHA